MSLEIHKALRLATLKHDRGENLKRVFLGALPWHGEKKLTMMMSSRLEIKPNCSEFSTLKPVCLTCTLAVFFYIIFSFAISKRRPVMQKHQPEIEPCQILEGRHVAVEHRC